MEFYDKAGTMLFTTGVDLPSYRGKFVRKFHTLLESQDMSKVAKVIIVTYWARLYFEGDDLHDYLESKTPEGTVKELALTYPDRSGWNMSDAEAKIFFPDISDAKLDASKNN